MGTHIKQKIAMRLFYRMALLSVFSTLCFSCSKDETGPEIEPEVKLPYANYEIVPGDDPFTFEFKNLSKDYTQVEWRFGDDIVSPSVSPTHVYMKAGDYQVNLKVFSESGGSARKMLDLKISPESIFSVEAERTSTPREMKFKITTKADVVSAAWGFSDRSSYDSFDITKIMPEGQALNLDVKIKSAKGSEAELKLLASTGGILTNITKKVIELNSSHENLGGKNHNEGTSRIIDNNVDTKWYMSSITFPVWNQFTFETPEIVKTYAIGSGNDVPERDPKEWTFQGSNDGINWEILDTRKMTSNFYVQAGLKYKQLFYYDVANPKPFLHYKFHVTVNFGQARFQISEFRLFK